MVVRNIAFPVVELVDDVVVVMELDEDVAVALLLVEVIWGGVDDVVHVVVVVVVEVDVVVDVVVVEPLARYAGHVEALRMVLSDDVADDALSLSSAVRSGLQSQQDVLHEQGQPSWGTE
eukprot:5386554-Amphidinium_carterae.2